MDFASVSDCFLSRFHIGLGDDFKQWCTGTIKVNGGCMIDRIMDGLARIFLKVGTGDTDYLFSAINLDGDRSSEHDRRIHLGNLIALRKVWVKVIFPIKARHTINLGADAKPELDRFFEDGLISDWQYAGQPHVDKAGLAVGCGTKLVWRCRRRFWIEC